MVTGARVALIKSLGALLEAMPERGDVSAARWLARTFGPRSESAVSNLTANLQHALYDESQSHERTLLDRFVDRAFASYGQYWAESAKLPAMRKAEIYERFAISEGIEYLDAARDRERGVVIALPHVGSWEWGGSFLHSLGYGMTAIAEELEPPELFEWFKKKRESIGIRIEPLNEHAGTVLLEVLRGGGVVGLLCDRDLQGNGVDVEFFGKRVTMPAGPATLALRTGATLLTAACYSGPGSDHHAVVCPPIDATRQARLRQDVARVTQLIAHNLEGLIRRAPEQWHVLQPVFPTP